VTINSNLVSSERSRTTAPHGSNQTQTTRSYMIKRHLCTHLYGEFPLTNTIINNHDNSVYTVNL